MYLLEQNEHLHFLQKKIEEYDFVSCDIQLTPYEKPTWKITVNVNSIDDIVYYNKRILNNDFPNCNLRTNYDYKRIEIIFQETEANITEKVFYIIEPILKEISMKNIF